MTSATSAAATGAMPMVPPRITFGIIVLNGEPFTRYCLRALYPWAAQIIVVEGACPAAAGVACPDGHSADDTLPVLRRFKQEEDPAGKLTIVTAEDEGHPNGFWPGEKHEMSQAYAKRASGDYLWQVDIDEFYLETDFPRIFAYLDEGYTQVNFPTLSFWGGIDYIENGKYFIVHRADEFRRLFRWGMGYEYKTHRPPTVVDHEGRDVARMRMLSAATLRRHGIYMYHYSMLLPKQVTEKSEYYSKVNWAQFEKMNEWAEKAYFRLMLPYHVQNTQHCTLAWLERWQRGHPGEIKNMMTALAQGLHPGIKTRQTADIDRLLCRKNYQLGKTFLRIYLLWLRYWSPLRHSIWRGLSKVVPEPIKAMIRCARGIS